VEATIAIPRTLRPRTLAGSVDPQAVAVWLLGCGLIGYLGLSGGGYDPILRDQLGITVWWGVLLGLAVGALPINKFRHGSWIALGLLGAYVGWIAISYIWTDAPQNTVEDLGRVLTYLGVFALALSIRGEKGARRMVSALATGIALVALVALLSRLHPAWFPAVRETSALLAGSRFRLAYPLGYWNGDAALIAIGLPLLLYVACSARHAAARALAAAALPAMVMTIYLTFSRGGALAALIAVALFLALVPDRLPKATTVLTVAVGAAILIVATHQRHALDEGLAGSLAHRQGDELLAMALVVCAGVGLIQAGLTVALRHGRRPAWSMPSRRASSAVLVGALAILLAVGAALDAPGMVADAWHEFKGTSVTPHGAARLESFSGNGRWPLWSSALEENGAAPVLGTGSGSFEGWWAEHGSEGGFVQDAHSLYLEALGELGIVGFALIVAFLGWILVAGCRRCLRAARARRTQLAAALAGCAAFCLGAGYDWLWQLAVVPIAFLLLASVLVSAGERRRRAAPVPAARLGAATAAAAAMVAIAIPLSSALALGRSQADFRDGNLGAALQEASDAHRAAPFASRPRVQEALVLEAQGRFDTALAPAREATRLEPHEWRAWVVRSRLEAESGRPRAALDAYRIARSLNPRSALFDR
jgi:O-antigen ligase